MNRNEKLDIYFAEGLFVFIAGLCGLFDKDLKISFCLFISFIGVCMIFMAVFINYLSRKE